MIARVKNRTVLFHRKRVLAFKLAPILYRIKICISMYLYISAAPREVFLTFREGANSAVTFLLYLLPVTTHPFPKGLFCCMSHIFPTLSLAAIYDKSYSQQRIQEGIVSFSEGTMMLLRGYSAVYMSSVTPQRVILLRNG